MCGVIFFFSSRRRHTRSKRDWSSDVCSSDLLVEGINMVRKHSKPSQENPQGGILNQEGAIHVSNVMPIDPKTGEPTRVGYEVRDGKKVRIAKKSGEPLDK